MDSLRSVAYAGWAPGLGRLEQVGCVFVLSRLARPTLRRAAEGRRHIEVESPRTGAIAPGDSGEQREAQRLILKGVEQRLGVTLVRHVFDLGDGVRVQINGYTAQPPTLVEGLG